MSASCSPSNRSSHGADRGGDLGVTGLAEVGVELADPAEAPRRVHGDERVGRVAQPLGPAERSHRHREHHTRGPLGARDSARSPSGGPGGDPVVDDDHRAVLEVEWRPVTAILGGPAFQLDPLALFDHGDVRLVDTGVAHDVVVEDAHAALTDRPQRQLGLHRHTQLADKDHVEPRAQRGGDLGGDEHTAPRQPHHDRVGAAQFDEQVGQLAPSVGPVGEDRRCHATHATRDDGPMSDQAAVLSRYLQVGFQALRWKLEGLSEYDLRRPLVPTGTNLLGVAKHVALVSGDYFGPVFGRPNPLPPFPEDEANADMWATPDESSAYIIGLLDTAAAQAESILAELPLDAAGTVPWWGENGDVTLHTIAVHLIAELNRHAGHADIVRELVDGQAGLRKEVDNLPTHDADEWAAYHARVQAAADLFDT